ncbi:MAG: DEAD-box ATP-dependent RNA helicase DeaD (CshA), partial [uncultured Solirubrobacterales bacterium]
DDLRRTRPLHFPARSAHPPRVRAAHTDPGADHPRSARGPRRDRPGPDRNRQDRGLRAAAARLRRSRRRGHPGARAHADPRTVHPGHPGPAGLRRTPRDQGDRGVRRRADPHPGLAAQGGTTGRRRHGRAGHGPDEPPRARPLLGPLRRPRRGRRDARPRLPRGRRDHPLARSLRPPDRALLGDHAAGDRQARREADVRPGDHQGSRRHADHRHRRAVPRRDERSREARCARSRAQGRAPRPGDRLRPYEDRRRPPDPSALRQRTAGQGSARRHEPGLARRGDDRLQGRPQPLARGHRHRRAGPRHRGGHPHHQLRRAYLARRLRAPHRTHRPGRALGPGHHPDQLQAAPRPRGHREARRPGHPRVVRGREERRPCHQRLRPEPVARPQGAAGGRRIDRPRRRGARRGKRCRPGARAGGADRRTGRDAEPRPLRGGAGRPAAAAASHQAATASRGRALQARHRRGPGSRPRARRCRRTARRGLRPGGRGRGAGARARALLARRGPGRASCRSREAGRGHPRQGKRAQARGDRRREAQM